MPYIWASGYAKWMVPTDSMLVQNDIEPFDLVTVPFVTYDIWTNYGLHSQEIMNWPGIELKPAGW